MKLLPKRKRRVKVLRHQKGIKHHKTKKLLKKENKILLQIYFQKQKSLHYKRRKHNQKISRKHQR